MSEQDIINQYFSRHIRAAETVDLSVGDDAAIVIPPKDSKLVITTDTLNADVHFFQNCKPEYVGHKSLAVNLSDVSAMGATPLWATVSLSIPSVDHAWLKGFSDGLYLLADTHKVKIIGGDLVKGPLSITIQMIGELKGNKRLLRNACQNNDLIYVSGTLGDASLGLKLLQDNIKLPVDSNHDYLLERLHLPVPRFDISNFIVEFAHAAIDVSDGFLIDLQRMLTMSSKAAEINLDKIPISNAMQSRIRSEDDIKELLLGGEDYELIFTVHAKHKELLEDHFNRNNLLISEVGKIIEGSGVSLMHNGKNTKLPTNNGFDHFS